MSTWWPPSHVWGLPVFLCRFIFASVFALSVLSPPDTSTGGWEPVCEHRLPLSFTHPLSSYFNTHLLIFFPSYEATKCPESPQFLALLLLLSFLFAPEHNCLSPSCSYGFWNVCKHRSSPFLFACFLSPLLSRVDLIACCGPEVSTFNPHCFRPENACFRDKFAMWSWVCAPLSLFPGLYPTSTFEQSIDYIEVY